MVYSKQQKTADIVKIAVFSIFGIIFIVPYLLVLIVSFSSQASIITHGYSLIPSALTFSAYKQLFTEKDIYIGLGNSILITVAGTVIAVAVTTCAAYALSKHYLKGRKIVNFLLIFAMLFSGGLIPGYLLIQKLHLLNTYFAIIIPGAMSPWFCLLIRSYFRSLPESLEEAAYIDGADDYRIFWTIYLPLSVPMLASIILFSAVALWNQWSVSVLYTSDNAWMQPLTVILRNRISLNIVPGTTGGTQSVDDNVKMATAILVTIPMIIAYPFLQKFFVTGMTLGSVKG